MNVEKARFNMVEQQIRTWEVLDARVLDLLSALPREQFVSPAHRHLAFADMRLPLGHGQEMLCPREEGRLLQALKVQPSNNVLEIGTGSGYLTALLASLARHVYSVDIGPEFVAQASERLAAHHLGHKVTLEVGDGASGWEHYAPYDVIAITGSLARLPESFKRSLKVGGRLFVIEGDAPAMVAKCLTRVSEAQWHEENLFETVVPRLLNAPQSNAFSF